MASDSLYEHGFARVAAAVPTVHLADAPANVEATLAIARRRRRRRGRGARVPRARPRRLQQPGSLPPAGAARGGTGCARCSSTERSAESLQTLLVVGLPLRVGASALQRRRGAVHRGRVLGVVPKTYLPNYREFYEKRQFSAGRRTRSSTTSSSLGARRAVRHRPALRRRDLPTSCSTSRSARTSGCRSRRARSPRSPARR